MLRAFFRSSLFTRNLALAAASLLGGNCVLEATLVLIIARRLAPILGTEVPLGRFPAELDHHL